MRAQEDLFLGSATPLAPVQPDGLDGMFASGGEPPGKTRLETLFRAEERGQGKPLGLPFVAIVIPTNVKIKVMPHLKGTYDRDLRTLFSDLEGFSQAGKTDRLNLSPPTEPEEPIFPAST